MSTVEYKVCDYCYNKAELGADDTGWLSLFSADPFLERGYDVYLQLGKNKPVMLKVDFCSEECFLAHLKSIMGSKDDAVQKPANDMDTCPICKERYIVRARCINAESSCNNGHQWHWCFACKRVTIGPVVNRAKPAGACTCNKGLEEQYAD
jgi:hypothetical protein